MPFCSHLCFPSVKFTRLSSLCFEFISLSTLRFPLFLSLLRDFYSAVFNMKNDAYSIILKRQTIY